MNDPDRFLFSATVGYAVARLAFAIADGATAKLQAFAERNRLMRKTYGPEQVRVIPEVPFDLNVEHEDPTTGERMLRTHHFVGKPDPSSGDYARFALATQGEGAEVVTVLMEILPRMIDNSDGVSATWKYRPIRSEEEQQRHANALGSALDAFDALEDRPGDRFYGPDGQLYPAGERKRFEDFEAGSSRRRLYHLMFVDTDAKVQMQTVTEIMKDLFAEASGRPTSA